MLAAAIVNNDSFPVFVVYGRVANPCSMYYLWCSSSLQRTLKPKQLLVDVSSLSSYVHSAPATGACTPTLSTQQASLNLCAKTCPGFSSCFLVAVEASSHRSYSSVAVCASSDSSLWSSPHNESSMCTAMGVAVWRARALRVIDWIGVF